MLTFLISSLATFVALFFIERILLAVVHLFGFVIVPERTCYVYTLFGKVVGTISEPGFRILVHEFGWRGFVVHWLGKRYAVDMRIDQHYLHSQPVNSEEGAPMGVGVWYEMQVSDPVNFLFKNSDPRGSLRANVSNATVRRLSNLPLGKLMEDRHDMSRAVRSEVSEKSVEWGYKVGSVYIRKVHFRDGDMIHQIEGKVVNRLRQVTSAIRQEGANRVSVIASTANRTAAVEFAKAGAMRPKIVGAALQEITKDPEIEAAVFDLLEVQKMNSGASRITLVPKNASILTAILASRLAAASWVSHAPASVVHEKGKQTVQPQPIKVAPAAQTVQSVETSLQQKVAQVRAELQRRALAGKQKAQQVSTELRSEFAVRKEQLQENPPSLQEVLNELPLSEKQRQAIEAVGKFAERFKR
ncbi:TPA: band 7 protein [Candidatus Sumerlaeota bacterium]|nr:band 7 protein [Candidatus Sumerlaeota bacterium]